METKDEKCGDCKYFISMGKNPLNLAAPARGQCRAMPPVPVVMGFVPSPSGTPAPKIQAIYPPVGEETPACGLWKEQQEIVLKN